MTKQVQKTAPQNAPQNANGNPQQNNLYISVKTFDAEGKTVGTRIVDMYHFNTAKWLYGKHLWWAMHNGDTVEINPATVEEIKAYLEEGTAKLAAKFNAADTTIAPVPAVA